MLATSFSIGRNTCDAPNLFCSSFYNRRCILFSCLDRLEHSRQKLSIASFLFRPLRLFG